MQTAPSTSSTPGTRVRFNKAIPPEFQSFLTLHVGTTELRLSDATLESGNTRANWASAASLWPEGATVQLKMTWIAHADAHLSGLTAEKSNNNSTYTALDIGTFDAHTTSYSATVPFLTPYVKLTPTVSQSDATVTVKGLAATSGSASSVITLNVGDNPITVRVTAQDGSTRDYVVNIKRSAPDISLAVSTSTDGTTFGGTATLMPAFSPDTTMYTAAAPGVTHVRVTPTVNDSSAATFTVDGTTVASGSPSGNIQLTAGTTKTVSVVVTTTAAPDGTFTRTYSIEVVAGHAATIAVAPNPVGEGQSAEITVTLTGAQPAAVSIPITVTAVSAESGDYSAPNSVGIAAGAKTGTATLRALQDADSDDETLTVALGSSLPANLLAGLPKSATVTIDDDEFTSEVWIKRTHPNPVREGATVSITLGIDPPQPRAMTIPLTLANVSSESNDYSSLSSITIGAGHATGTGQIRTNHDSDGDDEQFTVALGSNLPFLATASAHTASTPTRVSVIIDDDEVKSEVSIARVRPNPVVEGETVYVVVKVDPPQPNSVSIPVVLTAAGTAEANDYSSLTSITVPAGQPEGIGQIRTNHDSDADDEHFVVSVEADKLPALVTIGTPITETITIEDDEDTVQPRQRPYPSLRPGNGSLTVVWYIAADHSPYTSFDVEYRRKGTTSWSSSAGAALDIGQSRYSHTISSLSNGTTYQVRVRARNSAGAGPWSWDPSLNEGRATPLNPAEGTPLAPPAAPTISSVAPAAPYGFTNLTVTWNAVPGATAYNLQYRYKSNTTEGDWQGYGTNPANFGRVLSGTSVLIPGLESGCTYEVQMRSFTGDSVGAWSAGVTGTTESSWGRRCPLEPGVPPTAPTIDSVVPDPDYGFLGLVVTWSGGGAATKYEVAYKKDGTTDWRGIDELPSSPVTVYGLDPGATYEVRVRGVDEDAPGLWSDGKSNRTCTGSEWESGNCPHNESQTTITGTPPATVKFSPATQAPTVSVPLGPTPVANLKCVAEEDRIRFSWDIPSWSGGELKGYDVDVTLPSGNQFAERRHWTMRSRTDRGNWEPGKEARMGVKAVYDPHGDSPTSYAYSAETVETCVVPASNSAPTVSRSIADTTFVNESGTDRALLAGVFADADGDSLTITVKSSDTAVATVSTDQTTLTVTARKRGTATITVTASDGKAQVSETFTVTVKAAPVVASALPDITGLNIGDTRSPSLSGVFSDADGDAIAVTQVVSSDTSKVSIFLTMTPVNNSLAVTGFTLTAEDSGTATITVTARDSDGNTVSDEFDVTVNAAQEQQVNNAPTVASAISDATIVKEIGTHQVSLSGVFTDADSDSLTITASSSDEKVATVSVATDQTSLTVTAKKRGTATITVTAKDGNGGSVKDSFTVKVKAAPVVASAFPDIAGLEIGDTRAPSLSGVFSDADGDAVTITQVASSDTSKVSILSSITTAADGSISITGFTLTAEDSGTATITVTARDSDGNTVSDAFDVTVNAAQQQQVNNTPAVASAIDDATIVNESGTHQVSLSGVFTDADSDSLTITAESSSISVATASVAADYSNLTVTAQSRGTATITVTADDGQGGKVSDKFDVKVKSAPVAAASMVDVEVKALSDLIVGLSGVFKDADGDALTIMADTTDLEVASVSPPSQGGPLTVSAIKKGAVTITVTAEDSDGNTVSDSFDVTVIDPPGPVSNMSLSATSDSVTVSWDAPTTGGAVDGYIVRIVRKGGGGDGAVKRPGSGQTAVTFSGLNSGTTYEVWVRGQNADGKGDRVHAEMTLPEALPGVVTNLSVALADSGAGNVTVSWDAPEDGGAPDGYIVHIKPEDGGKGKTKTPKAKKTSVTFENLEAGQTYQVWVRAENEAGKGERVHATITLPEEEDGQIG